jgi:hypothetical protein
MNRDLEKILFTPYFSFNELDIEKTSKTTHIVRYNEEDFKKYDPHRIFTHKQKEECWNMVRIFFNLFRLILYQEEVLTSGVTTQSVI